MFKRKIYSKIKEWKSSSDGKTALLIEGARRVGKSTVVEEFAKNEYATYILIDFSTASNTIKELFEDMSDLNYFFYNFSYNIMLNWKRENQLSSLMKFNYVQKQDKQLRH